MSRYQPDQIEPKWQKTWNDESTFVTPQDFSKPKYYVLSMFPYPSGSGLHVGHPLSYTAVDIVARYKRMKGFNVLNPMGWDAFGLPAERHAVRTGEHPSIITQKNVDNFRSQLSRLGFSFDWTREVNTSSADYYGWTQWIFLKLHEQGLAYMAEVAVNWCPALGTVLANEEVQDGKYVETGDPVERRMMRQWMLRITVYAQRLLEDLETLDWPEGVLEMQRQWIGRSEGANVRFEIVDSDTEFTVYTTRPDTLWGATYCVLAPEHPLVATVTSADQQDAVEHYVHEAKNRSDRDRQVAAEREKTGVFTGAYAVNPVNGQPIPIWTADYVMMGYGTGAIMAVPAHDDRDHAFALKFGLPILEVVSGGEDVQVCAHTGNGLAVNSGFVEGLEVQAAKAKVIAWLEAEGLGEGRVQYKLRDWLFSRQRYWGEPFPILHGPDGEIRRVDAVELPITLPFIDAYKPTADGQPPLARAQGWLEVELDGKVYTRETNTMPQWAGSCWYYLRYMDPTNTEAPFSAEAENYWGPVDLYIGGVEHAVLHLLYARFWHKVLYDCGLVHTIEPFQKLFNQGMILAHSYRDAKGKYYHPSDVYEKDGGWYSKEGDLACQTQMEKMSKSRLNVVNPDDVVEQYGADALRVYEMFMGPLDQVKPWQMSGVEGVYRFLARVWRLFVDENTGELNAKISETAVADEDLLRSLHVAIKSVTEGIDSLRFNTPISRMMEFVKVALAKEHLPKDLMMDFLLILSPYAPHLAEELHQRMGAEESLAFRSWPTWDPAALESKRIEIAVQVQGKRRGSIHVPKDTSKEEVLRLAKEDPNVARHLEGVRIVKEIVVPGRLVNLVVRPQE
jgi:leucyl-tRNA synthetase